MSAARGRLDGTAISISDDNDVCVEEAQHPISPPTYQGQASRFNPMPHHMSWVSQHGGTMNQNRAQVCGTPVYNTLGVPYMGQQPHVIPTDAGPSYTYPSPPMPYGNWQPGPQMAVGMDMAAGTDAAGQQQASHAQMRCQSEMEMEMNSPMPMVSAQAYQNMDIVSPSQLAMTNPPLAPLAPVFQPSNMGISSHLEESSPAINSSPPPPGPSQSSPQETNNGQPYGSLNPSNGNGWTLSQEDLIRRWKREGKKVKQIGLELKRRFRVEKSTNSISKRWRVIKERFSNDAKVVSTTSSFVSFVL